MLRSERMGLSAQKARLEAEKERCVAFGRGAVSLCREEEHGRTEPPDRYFGRRFLTERICGHVGVDIVRFTSWKLSVF